MFVDAGEYVMREGVFSIEVDGDGRRHWVYLRRVRFVPVEAADTAEPHDELEKREDRLRALGYL